MKARQLFSLFASLILLFLFAPVALAQTPTPEPPDPFVQMSEDGIVDGTVSIVKAHANGPAWVVIHADADGKPGPVIGHAELEEGDNVELLVEIDEEAATPLLHAMLHVDEGVVGTFEFPGPDVPMTIGENIVMAIFSAAPPLEETQAAADATPTAAAEEETEAEAAAGAEATPTAAAEEETTAESAAGAEATPTAAAEEETAAEAAVTAAPEEEAEFAPTAVAAQETAAEAAAPADASAKGAAPTSMPATGAGPALSLILGVIGVAVSALGGSVLFSRRRS